MTPIEPARAYFDEVTAPRKEFVVFEGGGHFVRSNVRTNFWRN